MKKFQLRMMSGKGDSVVAEWDETTAGDRLDEIEAEFNKRMKEGYFAADLSSNELIDKFDAGTDMLLIPRMTGGVD